MNASPLYPEVTKELITGYTNGIASCFIAHGNVRDYIGNVNGTMVKMRDYLKVMLTMQPVAAEVIVFYDRSAGLTFASPAMEKKAKKLLGMDQPAQPANPALAALAQVTGQPVNGGDKWPKEVGPALDLCERLMKNDQKLPVAIILDYAETIVPAAEKATMTPGDRTALVQLCRWGEEPTNSLVILVTKNLYDLHPDLRSAAYKYESIEFPMPDIKLRKKYIAAYAEQKEITLRTTDQAAASLTAGLSLIGIEDIFLKAQNAAITDALIMERANTIIRQEYGNIAEIVSSTISMNDLKGNDALNDAIINEVIAPLQAGDKDMSPKGVLFMGVPGTGKSMRIKAIANGSGMRLLKLNIGGNIASKWQGEGERNLQAFLSIVKVFTPCMVWIGEVDQVLRRGEGSGSGGNQQENRIFQILMEFMADADNEGKVCFIFDTNRPDLMDSALKRAGRIDLRYSFFPPEEAERKAVMEAVAKKRLNKEIEIGDDLIEATEGWVHADLDEAAKKARRMLGMKRTINAAEAYAMAIRSTRPSVSTTQMEPMIRAMLREITDIDMIPMKYREIDADTPSQDAIKLPSSRRGPSISFDS